MYGYRHYIQIDNAGRIIDGWSSGPFPDRDTAGAIMLTDQGGYQFGLEPGGEENPVLTNSDGAHRYMYDASRSPAYREATAEELEQERAEIEAAREPVEPTAEEKQLDVIQEIIEMRAQLAQIQVNGGF